MDSSKRKCEMFGCYIAAEYFHTLGPGTYIQLCREHYDMILIEESFGYDVEKDEEQLWLDEN